MILLQVITITGIRYRVTAALQKHFVTSGLDNKFIKVKIFQLSVGEYQSLICKRLCSMNFKK